MDGTAAVGPLFVQVAAGAVDPVVTTGCSPYAPVPGCWRYRVAVAPPKPPSAAVESLSRRFRREPPVPIFSMMAGPARGPAVLPDGHTRELPVPPGPCAAEADGDAGHRDGAMASGRTLRERHIP
jgi:hypothetical protein